MSRARRDAEELVGIALDIRTMFLDRLPTGSSGYMDAGEAEAANHATAATLTAAVMRDLGNFDTQRWLFEICKSLDKGGLMR